MLVVLNATHCEDPRATCSLLRFVKAKECEDHPDTAFERVDVFNTVPEQTGSAY